MAEEGRVKRLAHELGVLRQQVRRLMSGKADAGHDHDGNQLTSEGQSAGRILEADGNGGVQWTDPPV